MPFSPLFFGFLLSSAPPVGCHDVAVHVVDKDPAGLNVRAAPDRLARVIGKLPTTAVLQVYLKLDSSSSGWVHFRSVSVEEGKMPWKHPLPKRGWIAASMVYASPGDGNGTKRVSLRLSPDSTSTNLGSIDPMPSGPQEETPNFRPLRVWGCHGAWLQIEGSFLEGDSLRPPIKGWLAPGDHCGSSLTNCN